MTKRQLAEKKEEEETNRALKRVTERWAQPQCATFPAYRQMGPVFERGCAYGCYICLPTQRKNTRGRSRQCCCTTAASQQQPSPLNPRRFSILPQVPVRRGKVLEASEMRRSRCHEGGGAAAAAAFSALLLGCVLMALVGGAAAQGPRLPSDYKTLSGNAPAFLPSLSTASSTCAVLYALLCFRPVRLFEGVGSCWQTQLGHSWG